MDVIVYTICLIFTICSLLGAYCICWLIWDETSHARYVLKTKLFPKWRAKFREGDHVTVRNSLGVNTLCKVTSAWVEKNDTVEIKYIVEPTFDYNKSIQWDDFKHTAFLENDVYEVR